MARRPRINPHDRGTAEHVLFASYRRHKLAAETLQGAADRYATDANAARAAAAQYAIALHALGHPVEDAVKQIEGPKS